MNPVMVEETRGRHAESYHRGRAVVVDSLGHIIRSWGNIYESTFGRSALKFIQAIPLIESGAADAFHLSSEEIALATASHYGEESHMHVLEKWLKKLGKDERILECGVHRPLSHSLRTSFERANALHNACSGKHLGMITSSLHRGEPLEGYSLKEHPSQRRIEQALGEMTDVDMSHAPHGKDGCGIPAFAFPLYNIALAMARFADPSHLHYPRQKSIHRILAAVKTHPELIAGSQGFDTKIIKMTQGDIICKIGAGGVEVGIIPSIGLGIALKIDDGNVKAAEVAFLAILRSLGCIDDDLYEKMGARIPVVSHSGQTVGFIQPTNFTTLPPESGHH
jgi:L-asparaginase II